MNIILKDSPQMTFTSFYATAATDKPLAFRRRLGLFLPIFYLASNYSGKFWSYFTTLEHECTHATVALLFLKRPISMRVTAKLGGEFQYASTNKIGETSISLAPYFLPTLSFLTLLTGFLLNLTDNHLFYAVLGWTVTFHLVTNWKETSFRQTDLQKVGIIKTLLVLPIANLLAYGSIFAFVVAGLKGFFDFWLNGGKDVLRLVKSLVY